MTSKQTTQCSEQVWEKTQLPYGTHMIQLAGPDIAGYAREAFKL